MKITIGKKTMENVVAQACNTEVSDEVETEIAESSGLENKRELFNARRENTRVFACSKNKMVSEYFSESKFYKVGNEYKKIDNTLIDKGNVLETKSNSFKTRFNKYPKGGKIFEIEHSGCKVAIVSCDAAKCDCDLENCSCEKSTKNEGRVKLKSIKGKSDIEYIAESDRVKENIIINEKADSYEYDFEIEIDGMYFDVSTDNRRLEFRRKETGKRQFFIPPPFMLDSQGIISDSVYYEINQINNEKLGFKVIADKEWINSSERKFPIIIDPQIVVDRYIGGYQYENAHNPNTDNNIFRYKTLSNGLDTGDDALFIYNYFSNYDPEIVIESELIIDKEKIDQYTLQNLISAELTIQIDENSFMGDFSIGDNYFYDNPDNMRSISIDVLDYFAGSENVVVIPFKHMSNRGGYTFKKLLFNSPILKLEYEENRNSLEIAQPPLRTKYTEGEKFDTRGMIINYCNYYGYKYEIKNYNIFPSGALKMGDNRVRITYGELSVDQEISVCSLFDSLDDVPPSTCDYLDNPKVCLSTGEVKYLAPDLFVGESSYKIGVSHVYSSQANSLSRLFTTCGNGWKLDMEQLLLKQTVNGIDQYKYVDGLGVVHSFVLFDSVNKRYYDAKDAGIELHISSSAATMKDAAGNGIAFNAEGKIDYTFSALNSAVRKKFVYVNGKLSKIYDTRKGEDECLSFEYAPSGLLDNISKIIAGKKVKSIEHIYNDAADLIATVCIVYDSNGNKKLSKLYHTYTYKNDCLELIVDQETKNAIKIIYNSMYAERISKGYVSGGEYNIGEFTAESTFLEKTYNKIRKSEFSSDNTLQEVAIETEKTKNALQLNKDGKIVSALELVSQKNYKTLSPEYGVKVYERGIRDTVINGENVESNINFNNSFEMKNISLVRLGEEDYLNYTCTMWLKLTSSCPDVKAVISYSENKKSYGEVDNLAVGSWQKIVVPLYFVDKTEKDAFNSCSLSIIGDTWNRYNFEVACIRIIPGYTPSLYLNGIDLNKLLFENMYNLTKFVHFDGSVTSMQGRLGLTKNDILRNLTSPVFRNETTNKVYDIVYANGKKKLANVTKILIDNCNLLQNFSDGNFYLESRSPDNKSRNRQCFSLTYNGTQSTLKVRNEVKAFKDGINSPSSEDKVSSKSVWYDAYSRKIKELDSFGVTTEYKYDNNPAAMTYGLFLKAERYKEGEANPLIMFLGEKAYDTNGEYCNSIKDGVLAQEFEYDRPLSQLERVTNRGIFAAGQSTSNTGALTTSFGYDEYGEKLSTIKQTLGNISRQNDLFYEDGALRTVTDGVTKYGIKNDVVNNKSDFTRFDGNNELNILTKSFSNLQEGKSEVKAEYYNNVENEQAVKTGESKIILDQYGRMKSTEYTCSDSDSTGSANISYQLTQGTSLSTAKVDKIQDTFENKTYKFKYGNAGELIGWSQYIGTNNEDSHALTLWQMNVYETIYGYGAKSGDNYAEKYKTMIAYDETSTIEQRVSKVINYFVNESGQWQTYPGFFKKYEYDGLGRLSAEIAINDGHVEKRKSLYEYCDDTQNRLASPLVKKYTYVHDGSAPWQKMSMNYDYTYDKNGRVIKEVHHVDNGGYAVIQNRTVTKNYEYNDLGFLISEKISDSERAQDEVKQFAYDARGRFKSYGNADVSYYEEGPYKGRISSVHNRGYIDYDNYGNRMGERDFTYNESYTRTYKYERGNLLTDIYSGGLDYASTQIKYKYNHRGVRVEKISYAGAADVKYIYDGEKLLGEDKADGTQMRYFYDALGVSGYTCRKYDRIEKKYITNKYIYVRDGFGNIAFLEDEDGKVIVRYEYDVLGNCKIYINIAGIGGFWMDEDHNKIFNARTNVAARTMSEREVISVDEIWSKGMEIARLNPFRWKGYYFDADADMYYINDRFYDAKAGTYINADDAENIISNAAIVGGLDRQAITLDNHLTVETNPYDANPVYELTADITGPEPEVPSGNVGDILSDILQALSIAFQVIAILANIVMHNYVGAMLLLGGLALTIVSMSISESNPEAARVLNGIGTIANGVGALTTGLSLTLSKGCGILRYVLGTITGGVMATIGVGTIGIGLNEALAGATGTNYLQDWTGMPDETYAGVYMGLNIASTVCNITGKALTKWKGNCFKEGTLVETEDGKKKIEDIGVGDKVLAYDEETGEQGYKEVVRLFRNSTLTTHHLSFDNSDKPIVCTPEHPFYILNVGSDTPIVNFEGRDESKSNGQWVQAKYLKVHDKVLLSDGKTAILTLTEVEHLSEPITTYNFEVQDFHTYYIGEQGILVHNACDKISLYRAMSNEEYGSLTKHGKFSTKNAAMAEKWMATTYDDAVTWGNKMMGQGNFRVVEIRMPTSSLSKMYYGGPLLDGIGPAYSAYYKYLNEVMIGFWRLL